LRPLTIAAILFVVLFAGCVSGPGENAQPSSPSSATPSVAASVPTSPAITPTQTPTPIPISRAASIPATAVKITPETDASPPESKTAEYENPVPLPAPLNTAGAEDSPFVTPDGNTLYFFFTPDPNLPVQKQIFDGVTGIWVSKKQGDAWGEPSRVMLQDPGKLAIDGCEFVQGNSMLFCSAREGYVDIHWFAAEYKDGKWQNWENADFNPAYAVGELHISPDGNELYFHSGRPGGKGGLDIWVSKKTAGGWGEPENVAAVNTERDDGWPALSPDAQELWIYRDYSIWRSKLVGGAWQEPEVMFSPLAGEATLDAAGNVYFTHHYYKDGKMLEADIYQAKKK
jgi:hypothetical protein